jgi:hypothetical protein
MRKQDNVISESDLVYYVNRQRFLQPANRLKLYRSLLKLYRSGYDDGLCFAIAKSSRKVPAKNIREFPELIKQKPRENYRQPYNGRRYRTRYWWAPTNRQKRIEVLEKAIATLTYQINKRKKNGKKNAR